MSKAKRREKARRRIEAARNKWPTVSKINGGLCWNGCGERGPHFVPPSFGDKGFYTCTRKEET